MSPGIVSCIQSVWRKCKANTVRVSVQFFAQISSIPWLFLKKSEIWSQIKAFKKIGWKIFFHSWFRVHCLPHKPTKSVVIRWKPGWRENEYLLNYTGADEFKPASSVSKKQERLIGLVRFLQLPPQRPLLTKGPSRQLCHLLAQDVEEATAGNGRAQSSVPTFFETEEVLEFIKLH